MADRDKEDDQPKAVQKKATNMSTGARGVNTVNPTTGTFQSTIILQPGESQDVWTSEAEMAGAADIVYDEPGTESEFEKADKIEQEKKDTAKQAKKAKKVGDADLDPDFDVGNMSDDELRDHLERIDGRKRPANTSRATLIEQAEAAKR
jgi:hypothetical protein